ncbi:MAG: hypothetical protein R3D45_09745 [Rhizobiaceae bacterium]
MKQAKTVGSAILVLGLLAMTGSAHAISRYNSLSLTCHAAQNLLAQQGAVIFRYPAKSNPSLTRYNRFVEHGGYCAHGEAAVPGSVPTADRKSCPMLYCRQRNDDGFGFRPPAYKNGLAN